MFKWKLFILAQGLIFLVFMLLCLDKEASQVSVALDSRSLAKVDNLIHSQLLFFVLQSSVVVT
uniref:Uncharacterized protein n=1 Tax=Rhizophora mucronata TaxID=61149 RepID=A0A2P2IRC4_RHIMU